MGCAAHNEVILAVQSEGRCENVIFNRRREQVSLESSSSCAGVRLSTRAKLQVRNYLSRGTDLLRKGGRELSWEEATGLYRQAGKKKNGSWKLQ